MRRYRFDEGAGRAITEYGSRAAVHQRVAQLGGPVSLGLVTLGPDGVLGHHPAAAPQLFDVVAGQGEVRGESDEWFALAAGEAAFWHAGESHATRTAAGLTAIVVEAGALAPAGRLLSGD